MTKAKAPIIVTVDGDDYEGWLESQVRRSLEELSGSFSLSVDYDPEKPPQIRRQDEVIISIGGVPVIKGFLLKADPFYSRSDMGMNLEGRDYAGDLVAGAAMHKGGQWLNTKLEVIAADIAATYGLTVEVEVDTGEPFARFELENGELCYQAIARAASYRGVMVCRSPEGQVLLTRAGLKKSHAAIRVGKGGNVISMTPLGSDEERRSHYIIQGQGEINHIGDATKAHQLEHIAKDEGLKRYLPIIVQADTSAEARDLKEQAEHMARVNMAKAYKYEYEIEGWEAKGKPWEINTRVPVYDFVLGLDGEEWLIVSAEATVNRDNADVTKVVIAPIAAYQQRTLKQPKLRGDAPSKKKKYSKKRKPKKAADIAPNWS